MALSKATSTCTASTYPCPLCITSPHLHLHPSPPCLCPVWIVTCAASPARLQPQVSLESESWQHYSSWASAPDGSPSSRSAYPFNSAHCPPLMPCLEHRHDETQESSEHPLPSVYIPACSTPSTYPLIPHHAVYAERQKPSPPK